MVEVRYSKNFLKGVKQLPVSQQKLLAKKLSLLQSDPFDSRLHSKQLSTPLQGIFSFRISREYRVLFRFADATTVVLIRAKHRKDIYR